MSYLLWNDIAFWDSYKFCYAPIQLFLAMTYGTFIFITIFFAFLGAPDLPFGVAKCFMFFLYWILNPFLIYLPIQGFTWQIENMVETPDCVPADRLPYMTWAWLVCISLLAALTTWATVLKIRNWIRIRLFRRRMHRFRHLIDQGDFEALNELLRVEPGMNNKTGLLPSEIERIPVQNHSQSFVERLKLSHLDACPICFEDFMTGDQVMTLPKCNHSFHPACVTGWLAKNPLCPMCRANVRTNLYQNLQSQIGAQGNYLENGNRRPSITIQEEVQEDLESPLLSR